ncbi:Mitochondrial import inner membrane translocase subunit tim8 [Gnomoniopsis sp. IMI 355080]|nr:Mitochondrial import inner membrane translocase subunit tim8 [Gnomoniopsis sp. IMI 355080]
MDTPTFDQSDLDRLSVKDKQELQQFITNEQQKARIQQRTHDLTQTCWNKCVPGTIKNNTLDNGEQTCLANCVDRFMDLSTLAVKHLQTR